MKLGTIGFGGAIALVGYLQRDLVEKWGWISKHDFIHGLTLAQLSPGPLATQLAIYIGWLLKGTLGATIVALSFIFPSFIIIVTIAYLYLYFGESVWMHGAFYGIGASVIAVVAQGAYNLARMVVDRDWLLWLICLGNFVLMITMKSESIPIFVLSGFIVLLIRVFFQKQPPSEPPLPPKIDGKSSSFIPVIFFPSFWSGITHLATQSITLKMGLYFAWAGAFVFGSGLAIIPVIHTGVVQEFHWLTEQQFLDAVAAGLITPGPILITVAFIGFLVSGLKGAFAATFGVFIPCYLIVIILAPHYQRYAHNIYLKTMILGITTAAAGAILGSTVILGQQAIIDLYTLLIFGVSLFLPLIYKKIPPSLLVFLSGIVGCLLKG